MIPPPTAIYRRAALLIGLGWMLVLGTLTIFATDIGPNVLVIGLVLGTVFQFALLAGTWCVLGPAPLMWRMPLSFIWAELTGLAMMLPLMIKGIDPAPHVALIITATLWLVVQLPLWVLALGCRLRLRLWHQGTTPDEKSARQSQFGIGQLMGFTAFVAVVLAGGRLLLAYHLREQERDVKVNTDWLFLVVLVTAQVVMGLPLSLACLLPRHVLPSVVVCLLLMAVVTAAEGSIVSRVVGGGFPPELSWIFVVLNLTSAAWTLAFAAVVRRSGYHFGVPSSVPMAVADLPEGQVVQTHEIERSDLSQFPPRPPL